MDSCTLFYREMLEYIDTLCMTPAEVGGVMCAWWAYLAGGERKRFEDRTLQLMFEMLCRQNERLVRGRNAKMSGCGAEAGTAGKNHDSGKEKKRSACADGTKGAEKCREDRNRCFTGKAADGAAGSICAQNEEAQPDSEAGGADGETDPADAWLKDESREAGDEVCVKNGVGGGYCTAVDYSCVQSEKEHGETEKVNGAEDAADKKICGVGMRGENSQLKPGDGRVAETDGHERVCLQDEGRECGGITAVYAAAECNARRETECRTEENGPDTGNADSVYAWEEKCGKTENACGEEDAPEAEVMDAAADRETAVLSAENLPFSLKTPDALRYGTHRYGTIRDHAKPCDTQQENARACTGSGGTADGDGAERTAEEKPGEDVCPEGATAAAAGWENGYSMDEGDGLQLGFKHTDQSVAERESIEQLAERQNFEQADQDASERREFRRADHGTACQQEFGCADSRAAGQQEFGCADHRTAGQQEFGCADHRAECQQKFGQAHSDAADLIDAGRADLEPTGSERVRSEEGAGDLCVDRWADLESAGPERERPGGSASERDACAAAVRARFRLPGYAEEQLKHYCEALSPEAVRYAADEALANGCAHWKYLRAILERYVRDGIGDTAAAEADAHRFRDTRPGRGKTQTPNREYQHHSYTDAEYDEMLLHF